MKISERLKRIKIFSYFRELSIVIIGVLVTLAITDKVNESSKQKEVKETLQLVQLELQNNLEQLEKMKTIHHEDTRMLRVFRNHLKDIKAIPADTLMKYPNLFGRILEFNPKKDAYDVFKSSALMQYVKDKVLILELMTCYSALSEIENAIHIYSEMKSEAIQEFKQLDYDIYSDAWSMFMQNNPYPYFELLLRSNDTRRFLNHGVAVFDEEEIFDGTKILLENMISKIEKKYK